MRKHAFQPSKKVDSIPEALSIYMNQLVYSERRKGIDIITLSLGESYFEIPMYSFSDIDFVKGYHYSDSMGLPELREQILRYYNDQYGSSVKNIQQIMVSCGSKVIIYMVMQAVLNDGDEVLIHEPAWLSYQEQAKLAGGNPVFIPYHCTIDRFETYFSEKTKLLVLNNPNNPAGWLYTEEELRHICNLCAEKGVYILMDEAYSDFVNSENRFCSLAKVVPDLNGVFVVNSLSKNMGMSGWRVGYVLSSEEQIRNLLKLNQHLITCAPTVLQMYISNYFDEIIRVTIPQVKEAVEKRKRVLEYIDSIGLKHLPGASTFYIFLDLEESGQDIMDFCLYLLFKYGIAVVPGKAYGKSTESFIRIGIGVESEERIHYALDIIKTVMKGKLVDRKYVDDKLKKNGFHRFEEK